MHFEFDGQACKKGGFLQAQPSKNRGCPYLLSTSRIANTLGKWDVSIAFDIYKPQTAAFDNLDWWRGL